jgi:molybdopterin adenylyltransferase
MSVAGSVVHLLIMSLLLYCRAFFQWMVVEARKLVDKEGAGSESTTTQAALAALGYEEAAQHVYGMNYGDWKKRHLKKATDEQLAAYQASVPMQAKHDKALLATRGEKPTSTVLTKIAEDGAPETLPPSTGLLSNVCCQDAEDIAQATVAAPMVVESKAGMQKSRTLGAYQPPSLPTLSRAVRIAVLTISDRAYRKEYATGDLSGPAVVAALQRVSQQLTVVDQAIVPDEAMAIREKLGQWASANADTDIILTTGGTGMSPRDVTPEATRAVLDTECAGLMSFVANECSRLQPLASLSRGTAGLIGPTLVANLPGNPRGIGEIMPILLPLLLHAWVDIQAE